MRKTRTIQAKPKPPKQPKVPSLSVTVEDGEVVLRFTEPMQRLTMTKPTALHVVRLLVRAVEEAAWGGGAKP